jgi:electron transport complex protein RnfC
LVQYYRYAKGEIAKNNSEAEKAEQARLRFEAHKIRLAQEEADKEARRKAREEAAAKAKEEAAKQAALANQHGIAPPAIKDSKSIMIAAATARSNLKKARKTLIGGTTSRRRLQPVLNMKLSR